MPACYEGFGPEDREAMLLIMGNGARLTTWPAELIEEPVRRGYRVVIYDNRDVGLSTKFDRAGVPDAKAVLRGCERIGTGERRSESESANPPSATGLPSIRSLEFVLRNRSLHSLSGDAVCQFPPIIPPGSLTAVRGMGPVHEPADPFLDLPDVRDGEEADVDEPAVPTLAAILALEDKIAGAVGVLGPGEDGQAPGLERSDRDAAEEAVLDHQRAAIGDRVRGAARLVEHPERRQEHAHADDHEGDAEQREERDADGP